MFSFLTGLTAGLVHVVSGPDHLAAIAPLSAERGRRPWTVGVRWGLGHAGGVMLVGLLSIAFRGLLPIDYFSSFAERVVGIVLVGVGIWGIRRALAPHLHEHAHRHGGEVHSHIHVHAAGDGHAPSEGATHRHGHAAIAIGALHGFAGGSHFLGVLPAMAFSTPWQSFTYLLAYGLGTIGAMGIFSGVMGFLAGRCATHGVKAYRVWMMGCSGAAVVVGGCWLVISLTP